MKLQVTQENLNKALSSVGRIANTRGTLPILSNILLKTIGKRLSIAATNLDIAITHTIGAKVIDDGSITIPARLLVDFIASLPPGTINLKLEDNKLNIETNKYQSTINGTAADDFPVMPAIQEGKKWNIDSKQFKRMLQQVLVAASNDEARPVLTGVYFHVSQSKLVAVTTDSYRLAEKSAKTNAKKADVLVPASALQDLLRLLDDSDDLVSVIHDDQQIQFKVGGIELVARLIEGNYPEYQKLIPDSFEHQAELSRKELTNITKVSSLFARESAGSVTLELDDKTQAINIRSIASQLGENTASADARITGGGSITLNSRYILDALNALEGDEVKIAFNGKLEPCVLTSPNSKDYLHVIMPLKS